MSLADEPTWEVLSHAVAAIQQLRDSDGGTGGFESLHRAQVLESVHGLLGACKAFLYRTCEGNLTCKGCYFSKAVMPTLASELAAVADITLCASATSCRFQHACSYRFTYGCVQS
jgi:hypothetical protein